jgi:DNA polymerase I-like protein with 3'-5' exonuclease and polymerase domains
VVDRDESCETRSDEVSSVPNPWTYPSGAFAVVTDPADLTAVGSAVEESARVGLDLETTGLDPRTDRVRLIALSVDTADGGRFSYLIDCQAVDPTPLWEPLAASEIVGHNLQFDLQFLGQIGFSPGRVRDTMLLSQVLHAAGHTRGKAPIRHGLKDCCLRELGVTLEKELQTSDWTGTLSTAQLEYAAADVAVLEPLLRALTERLAASGLERVAAIESAALPCVAWMSQSGVQFDSARWRSLAEVAKAEAERFAAELHKCAPPKPGTLFSDAWNWESPEQVRQALGLAGCPVESTADGVLAGLDHPLAELVRGYRDARKRETNYGAAWLQHVTADGRVYPKWVQLGANSGRMACGRPNMQNLPRGEYRKCVVPPPGRVLVKADYSQIELRIAAKVSGDVALLAAFQRGDDLHALTARAVLGVSEVSKVDRQLAKAVNFGLLYGMGARGFRDYAKTNYGLDLTLEQAEKYRTAFFRAYPGLRAWHKSIRNGPQDVRTLTGRRVLGVEQFNEKLNLPVQGTGADGLKIALGLLRERRAESPGTVPVLAVHDEIVVECDTAQANFVEEWLRAAMIDAMRPLIDPVPVQVDVAIARTWGGD